MSKVSNRYLKVQGLHRVPKVPRYLKGMQRSKVSKRYLKVQVRQSISPCIFPRVSGHPHSAQESAEMRSLHQRGRETKKFLFLSSSCLCLMGWGSSSLEILQVCSWADPGSSQLGTPVAKRCCRGFLEVYRVHSTQFCQSCELWE